MYFSVIIHCDGGLYWPDRNGSRRFWHTKKSRLNNVNVVCVCIYAWRMRYDGVWLCGIK